jgi:hypothetical protein
MIDMRHLKRLGLALMAVFAFGVVVAATAWAEEKEPVGILYLSGEEGPVSFKGTSIPKTELKQLGVKNTVSITAEKVSFEGELGKGEGKHATLGSLAVTYTGVKLGKIACSSETQLGTKDAKEVVLLKKENTDIHTVSLETAEGKLVPGLLVGLLEEEKHDLTLNCGGVKVLVLGATFLEVKGAVATGDVNEIAVLPILGKCDKNDELCKQLLEKWGVKADLKHGEVIETVLCPLGSFIEKLEECAELKSTGPVSGIFSHMVEIDF